MLGFTYQQTSIYVCLDRLRFVFDYVVYRVYTSPSNGQMKILFIFRIRDPSTIFTFQQPVSGTGIPPTHSQGMAGRLGILPLSKNEQFEPESLFKSQKVKDRLPRLTTIFQGRAVKLGWM